MNQVKLMNENTYCYYVQNLDQENVHKTYHDSQYGFPIKDDNELFGRLIFEINQAGMSWTIILNKQENFRKAYDNFNITKIAAYGEDDYNRLMNDAGIVRNKLKIRAAIHNAKVIVGLQKEYGSFQNWLDSYHPKTKEEWVKLFKKTFKFTGGEITNEFLMSSGYLKGAHHPNCPIYKKVAISKPKWMSHSKE